MCVAVYLYIHEWETDKNTNFYVIHNLKYNVPLNTNQTHMVVLC
jgi:hypothetical protein